MRIVVAPDSFKGTLTAHAAAAAMAAGVRAAAPAAEVVRRPIADGGEGTVAAFLAAGAEEVRTRVSGPLGEPVTASWARRGPTAVVEAAAANGLDLLTPTPATALAAATDGVGEIVRAVLDAGATALVLGVGGSATTDGGSGLARALGARFLDAAGRPLASGGGDLHRLARLDVGDLDPRLRGLDVTVACDVDNPLTGPTGAAAVYGPQKGAGPAEIEQLDRGLERLATVLADTDPAWADLAGVPGAGAAGGLAVGAIAFLGARLTSGAALVLDVVGMDDALAGADLVVVGEGRLDGQSLRGKGPGVLAARAASAGADVLAVAGRVDLTPAELAAAGITRAFGLVEAAADDTDARARAAELLTGQTARAVRWWLGTRAHP